MKKNKIKYLVILLLVLLLTGCTTVLKDSKTKKAVFYETNDVKITLYENILCQPEDKGLIKKYAHSAHKFTFFCRHLQTFP